MERSNYKKLGQYIKPVAGRNKGTLVTKLMGISYRKVFIPSIANIIGTDLSTYRVIKPGDFAFCPVTSRNGDRITIARYKGDDDCIISSAYLPFRVIDENKLDPDYLMMWVMRPEFDRYARFHSYGSVREIFSWDEMCNVMLPVPDIEEQKRIVSEYQAVEKRIEHNKQLVRVLEDTAITIYNDFFKRNFEDDGMTLGELFIPRRGKTIVIEDCVAGEVPVIAAGLEPACFHNESNTKAPVITISASGANAGYIRLNRQKVWASDCSYVDDSIFPYLYYAYVSLKKQQDYILSLQEGTGQGHIYPDHIAALHVNRCSIEKIREYNDKVYDLFQLRFVYEDENEQLMKILPLLLKRLA